VIAELSRESRSSFARAPHLKRKKLMGGCLGGGVIDRIANVGYHCARPMPPVADSAGDLNDETENAKVRSNSPASVRAVVVPGTGTDVLRKGDCG